MGIKTKHQPATQLPWEPRTKKFHHEVLRQGGIGPTVANVRGCAGPNGDTFQDARYIAHAANAYPKMIEALKAALAALTQPATFPADIEAARLYLRGALSDLGEI